MILAAEYLAAAWTAAAIYLVYCLLGHSTRRLPLPPGPPGDPIIGHLRLLRREDEPEKVYHKWTKKYGDVIRVTTLGRSTIILGSQQAASELLEKRSGIYSDRPNTPVYDIMGWSVNLAFTKYTSTRFRKLKRMFQQTLSQRACVQFRQIQIENAHIFVNDLMENKGDYGYLVGRYATSVSMRIAYGHQIRSDDDEYIQVGTEGANSFLVGGTPGATVIDLFPILKHFPNWFPALFAMAMILYPECQKRGQEEIDRIVGRDRLPTFEDKESLPYVSCIVEEILRWYPSLPSGVAHRSSEDDIYRGMFIPKGSVVIANLRGISLDETVYRNPTEFNPSRFLPKSAGGNGEPVFSAAFGFGRRICPGKHLASGSVWIAVATMLSTLYIMKAKDEQGNEITPLMEFDHGLISHIKDFPCNVTVQPPSPFHHNVLTLPKRLTAEHPRNSFLFDSYSDPPTATLQRIKALTTGSLPTFVDIGNNFGASSIAEDSIIRQLQASGKKIAFMGDDTWLSVFPDSFHPNMSFPYDSFNVEDLHTVDEGVITHLFPLLLDESKPFDFLIGHFLGVDHVGHRVGPDHQSMKNKLMQMNTVLEKVVQLLDDDTLLVVLGDHGMDRTGDHGGDGDLETSAALWLYSKTKELGLDDSSTIPSQLLGHTVFPGATKLHRRVQQIDLVPTMSLLLGLPIPFNNLGSVIPEVFQRAGLLSQALEINAVQIKSYLDAYRSSPSGGELSESWSFLEKTWFASVNGEPTNMYEFNRLALSTCRSLWAQFNPMRMGFGLCLLVSGLLAMWSLYAQILSTKSLQQAYQGLRSSLIALVVGIFLGVSTHTLVKPYIMDTALIDYTLFIGGLAGCLPSIWKLLPTLSARTLFSPPILLILHTLAFFSNSFTFWEDRVVPFLLASSILPFILKGFTGPTARLRNRILGFSALFAVSIRLMAISTVCREEQQPYCHVTYYASSSLPSPPLLVRILALPAAFTIPLFMQRVLNISRSDAGIAKLFLLFILRFALMTGSAAWVLEWVDSAQILGSWGSALRSTRSLLGVSSFATISILAPALWYAVPTCLDVTDEANADELKTASNSGPKKRQIRVIGFGNAFGSPYLLFWSIPFCWVFVTSQLTGQLVLGLSVVALLSYLEVVDSARDVRALEEAFSSSTPSAILQDPGIFDRASGSSSSPQMTFSEVVPIALLGLQVFYATGHQATISSIQWKSAFVLTKDLVYPFAPMTVILNSLGPLMLAGVSAPLVALWNRSPLTEQPNQNKDRTESAVRRESVLAGLGVMIYYGCLLLGTAVSAAILRRHLMVWKVFAPRFMLGALSVVVVNIGVLLGVGLGVARIAGKVEGMFAAVVPQVSKR
ncbi:mannose-ethanolamine phosphotransferase gpi13 [Pleurotus pulmonarius]|nr:mannose-ethanolamine phosphotransferase gpi13 [Pleurotus pulmonarius]